MVKGRFPIKEVHPRLIMLLDFLTPDFFKLTRFRQAVLRVGGDLKKVPVETLDGRVEALR